MGRSGRPLQRSRYRWPSLGGTSAPRLTAHSSGPDQYGQGKDTDPAPITTMRHPRHKATPGKCHARACTVSPPPLPPPQRVRAALSSREDLCAQQEVVLKAPFHPLLSNSTFSISPFFLRFIQLCCLFPQRSVCKRVHRRRPLQCKAA